MGRVGLSNYRSSARHRRCAAYPDPNRSGHGRGRGHNAFHGCSRRRAQSHRDVSPGQRGSPRRSREHEHLHLSSLRAAHRYLRPRRRRKDRAGIRRPSPRRDRNRSPHPRRRRCGQTRRFVRRKCPGSKEPFRAGPCRGQTRRRSPPHLRRPQCPDRLTTPARSRKAARLLWRSQSRLCAALSLLCPQLTPETFLCFVAYISARFPMSDSPTHARSTLAYSVKATTRPLSPDRDRANWLILGAFAVFTFAIHLVFYKGYGFFRDELYFIACGKHLAWGYVDQPPGAPLVAWFSQKILGQTLFAIRFVPVLFATAQILLTGLTARAMGGRAYAQFLACLCVLAAPQYFGSYLNTDMFMTLGWAACAWVAARICAGESPRLWLLFGLFGGLALEGKHAMLFFLLAFLVAVVVSPRRKMLLTPWPWYCAAVAFAIALPHVIWEYKHRFATYQLLSNIARSNKNLVLGPWPYLHSNIESLGILTILVWVPGLVWCLFLRDGKLFRAIGWTWIFAFALFIDRKSVV